jgi:hypothetical protein
MLLRLKHIQNTMCAVTQQFMIKSMPNVGLRCAPILLHYLQACNYAHLTQPTFSFVIDFKGATNLELLFSRSHGLCCGT